MEKILEINNLTTQFISNGILTNAVEGLNLSLNRGEVLGIVGESGSGKSVTALSIMQLLPKPQGVISAGEICYYQHQQKVDLLSLSEKEMRSFRGKEIAMVFQQSLTSLNPVFTCGFQVAEAFRLHTNNSRKEAKEQTIELFKKVLLPEPFRIFNAYPHQLSGGQLQRVMIAMAISCEPSILIADEPTTSLDSTVQMEILKLLKSFQQEKGMSIIFISHDLGVIAAIADRVAVLHKGKKVEESLVKEMLESPKHAYTKELLACCTAVRKLPVVSDFIFTDSLNIKGQAAVAIESAGNSKPHAYLKGTYEGNPVLKVEQLSTCFNNGQKLFAKNSDPIKAVDNVSFEIYNGETLGLVGESGSGKTTLAKTILRLIEPVSGSIKFNNEYLHLLNNQDMRLLRKQMQIIFQDSTAALNPRLRVGDAIMEPMQVHRLHGNTKLRKEKTMELLKRIELSEAIFYRYPFELSGGERQRICIARALATEPQFIICDECVSSLDVSVQAQVLSLLNDLKVKFKFTCLFISHNLSVVKFMSDRIMVMKDGKIEEIGDADEMYINPKSEYTKKLIASVL